MLGIARDMEEVCPDAWFLNYTNPLAMLVRAVAEASPIKVVGLCHSVFWTVDTLAGYLGMPREEIDADSAGVNHLAFMLRLEHRGRDLYPDLRAFVEAGRTPDDDLVRADLFRRLGYYLTESSEHQAEYNPWFIGKRDAQGDTVERFHVPIGEYLQTGSPTTSPSTPRRSASSMPGGPFEHRAQRRVRGHDRGGDDDRRPARIVGNVINRGTLIPNLEADACVEVPCLVDGRGRPPGRDGRAAAPARGVRPGRRRHAGADRAGRPRP